MKRIAIALFAAVAALGLYAGTASAQSPVVPAYPVTPAYAQPVAPVYVQPVVYPPTVVVNPVIPTVGFGYPYYGRYGWPYYHGYHGYHGYHR